MSKAQREVVDAALRSRGVPGGTIAERREQFADRIRPGDAAGLAEAEVTLGGWRTLPWPASCAACRPP